MAVAFIQGASRGIGLEFCRALSARGGVEVVAGCRDPTSAPALASLPRVTPLQCDVTSEEQLETAADWVRQRHGKLDFAINVAGILHPSGRGETRLQDVKLEDIQQTVLVNTLGPLVMAKYFVPLLQRGSGLVGRQSTKPRQQHAGLLAHISARVGSITDNRLGGWYGYRTSKAGLNMVNKTLSVELGRGKQRVVCLCLHPGTTDTDLSRPYHRGVPAEKLFSTEFSVSKMMEIIDNASLEESGKFLAWDGSEIPY